MRWLLVQPGPNFSVADVHNGWAEALRGLGEQVMEYELDRRLTFFDLALLETGTFDDSGHAQLRKAVTRDQAITMAADGLLGACYRWWPDAILCTSAFFTPPWVLEVMRARKHKIVMLFTEGPYQTDMQLKMAEYADLSLVNDPCDIEKYRAVCPAEYMPHSYRPGLHHPGPAVPEMTCDLGFVGTGFPSRIEFLEKMDLAGLDVILAGHWLGLGEDSPLRGYVAHDPDCCLDNEQTADVYRSARCGLNLYRREAEEGHAGEGWAMGPREVEMAASQLFYLRDPRPEGDELLPMLPTFTTPEQAGDLLRWYLAHPGQREKRAVAAREAIADRTFENHAKSLLRLLDRQPARM
jgi:spore maturation protein CgeB